MRKPVYVCEEVVSEMCDNISEALVDCADRTLSNELKTLVEITAKHYKSLLINMMFEKGEETNE